MIFDAIYRQGNILGSALQAATVRNDVITNNIANAEVPGYKAKTIDFEKSLTDAVNNFKRTGVLDLSNAKPFVRYLHPSFNYRIDQNNVDVELEMISLYENSIKFEAMVNCVQRNSARLNLALTGR